MTLPELGWFLLFWFVSNDFLFTVVSLFSNLSLVRSLTHMHANAHAPLTY